MRHLRQRQSIDGKIAIDEFEFIHREMWAVRILEAGFEIHLLGWIDHKLADPPIESEVGPEFHLDLISIAQDGLGKALPGSGLKHSQPHARRSWMAFGPGIGQLREMKRPGEHHHALGKPADRSAMVQLELSEWHFQHPKLMGEKVVRQTHSIHEEEDHLRRFLRVGIGIRIDHGAAHKIRKSKGAPVNTLGAPQLPRQVRHFKHDGMLAAFVRTLHRAIELRDNWEEVQMRMGIDTAMHSLPKVELHLHLDCSLSYGAVSRLAPEISREEYDEEFIAPPVCASLADFLTRAPRGFQLMQSEDALRIVTEDVFEQLGADNVIYAELRFAPLLHTHQGLTPEAVVAAVDRATEECIRATGIEARLILCTLRHFNAEQSLETARLVKRFERSRVVALDIAGDEAGFPIEPHIPAYRFAIENGLDRTAHAGEARGADSVWETLKAFDPTRIGHGVRSVEDPALLKHLRDRRIHLEICPSSNVQTRAFPSYAEHCADELYRAGVSMGINTDARTITNVTLEQEYGRLREAFGWGQGEFLACNREALLAAFLEDSVRDRLIADLVAASLV